MSEVNKNNSSNEYTSKKTFKQIWNSQIVDEEVKKDSLDVKKILKQSILGSTMGLNSVVYGSSSSLIAYQNSNYEKMVNRFCDLFTPKSFLDFCWKLLWSLPFFFSFLATFIIIFAINSALYFAGYELVLIFAFIGINLVSLAFILFLPNNRPTSLINHDKFSESKDKTLNLIIFIFAFIVVLAITFVARFVWTTEYPFGHINSSQFETIDPTITQSMIMNKSTIETTYALQIIAAGFLCGLTSFIPGLSGSFMLAVLGSNSYINTATRYAFGGFKISPDLIINSNWAWSTIIITFIGLVLGFVSSCFIMRYLLNKNKNGFDTMVFGLGTSLFIATFISLFSVDYLTLGKEPLLLGLSLAMMFLIIAASPLYFYFIGKKKNLSFSWMWKSDIDY